MNGEERIVEKKGNRKKKWASRMGKMGWREK